MSATQLTYDEHKALSDFLRKGVPIPANIYAALKGNTMEFEVKDLSYSDKSGDLDDLLATFVFIENTKADHKSSHISTYYNGEYFVVRETERNLYTVNTDNMGDHNTGEVKIWPKADIEIIDVRENDDEAWRAAADILRWASTPERGEETRWIVSCYSRAKQGGNAIRAALEKKAELKAAQEPDINVISDILPLDKDLVCPHCDEPININVDFSLVSA